MKLIAIICLLFLFAIVVRSMLPGPFSSRPRCLADNGSPPEREAGGEQIARDPVPVRQRCQLLVASSNGLKG
jgi:hypothetical protein